MPQCLAAMAGRIEVERSLELGQTLAEHRHVLDRRTERLAGPQSNMDPDSGDLAAFPHRYDDQVERHPAMDGRLAIGLGHERLFPALLEIADRSHATAFVGRVAG